MSRKLAREIAFKVVFSNYFHSEKEEVCEESINRLADLLSKDAELLNLNEENDENSVKTLDPLGAEDKKYIEEVSIGVLAHTAELDEKIKLFLKGWTMDRIGKADLAILRLAIFEILYREDIPYKVSINEAVELAKKYCDDTSPSFINGLLATFIHSLEE